MLIHWTPTRDHLPHAKRAGTSPIDDHSPFLAKLSTEDSSIPGVELGGVMQGIKDEHSYFLGND